MGVDVRMWTSCRFVVSAPARARIAQTVVQCARAEVRSVEWKLGVSKLDFPGLEDLFHPAEKGLHLQRCGCAQY